MLERKAEKVSFDSFNFEKTAGKGGRLAALEDDLLQQAKSRRSEAVSSRNAGEPC